LDIRYFEHYPEEQRLAFQKEFFLLHQDQIHSRIQY